MGKKKNIKELEKNEFCKPEDYVPTGEKVCYGLGALMDGGGVALMSCVMLKYMTTNGIAMAVASTLMMIAKIWDAITDPLMGFISDNSRNRYGRRKPYMIIGGIALIVAIFMLFMPVRSWGMDIPGFTAYILIMYLVWNTASTCSQVPYTSMASDISPSFRERNNANTVKLVFSAIASGLAYALPLLFIESLISADGYLFMPNIKDWQFWILMAVIFGGLFGGGLIVCGVKVKERIKATEARKKFSVKIFFNNYIQPFKNKSYRAHIIMYASAFMCMDMISALAVYYATDVWHGYKCLGMDMSSLFIVAPLMVAAVLMFPIDRILMDKKSKQFAFRLGLPLYILGAILLAVADPSWCPTWVVPIVAFLMGLGFGGAQMIPWIIFPDTLDVCELATNSRPTGTYSGMMTLIRKVAGALGVGMIGWIIGGAGYIENTSGDSSIYIVQSDKTLLAIRLTLGIAVAVFIAVALLFSFFYKVDNKKLIRIRYFVEAAKSGKVLTEEEQAEKAKLVSTLYGKVNPKDVVEIIPQVEEVKEVVEDTVAEPSEEEKVEE